MNKIEIIGRIGGDAQVREANGVKSARFNVAVSEHYYDKNGEKHDDTIWYACELYGKEGVFKYITKGSQVYVSGRVSAYVGKDKDGNPSARLTIYVQQLELLGKPAEDKKQEKSFMPMPFKDPYEY